MKRALPALLSSLLASCAGRELASESGDGSMDSTTTGGDATTSETQTGSSGGSGLENCGDGILDPGEQCDDGNVVDRDGCNSDCVESGTVRWSVGFEDTQCRGLAADREGGVYLAGDSALLESSVDAFVRRLGPQGEVEWEVNDLPMPNQAPVPFHESPSGRGFTFTYAGRLQLQARGDTGELLWDVALGDAADPTHYSTVTAMPAHADAGSGFVVVTTEEPAAGVFRVRFRQYSEVADELSDLVVAEGESVMEFGLPIWTQQRLVFAGVGGLSSYELSGAFEWSQVYDDALRIEEHDAAPDGSTYVALAESIGDDASVFVHRYDASGDLGAQWQHEDDSEGGTVIELDAQLAVDGWGDVLVATDSTDVQDPIDSQHVRVAKYGPAGAIRWSRTWEVNPGTGRSMRAIDLVVRANGDVIFVFDDPIGTLGIDSTHVCRVVAITP